MCCAPIVYMFVYILLGAQIVPVAGDLAIHCPYMLYGVIVCVGVRCMCSVSYER